MLSRRNLPVTDKAETSDAPQAVDNCRSIRHDEVNALEHGKTWSSK
jgi:hypothetical protein